MNLEVVKLIDANNIKDQEFLNKIKGDMLVEFKRGQIIMNDEWYKDKMIAIQKKNGTYKESFSRKC